VWDGYDPDDDNFEQIVETNWYTNGEIYLGFADAALAVIREPTEAMVYAMEEDAGHSLYRWQAAIDAARNEQPDEDAG
jgi:hypothetical protein